MATDPHLSDDSRFTIRETEPLPFPEGVEDFDQLYEQHKDLNKPIHEPAPQTAQAPTNEETPHLHDIQTAQYNELDSMRRDILSHLNNTSASGLKNFIYNFKKYATQYGRVVKFGQYLPRFEEFKKAFGEYEDRAWKQNTILMGAATIAAPSIMASLSATPFQTIASAVGAFAISYGIAAFRIQVAKWSNTICSEICSRIFKRTEKILNQSAKAIQNDQLCKNKDQPFSTEEPFYFALNAFTEVFPELQKLSDKLRERIPSPQKETEETFAQEKASSIKLISDFLQDQDEQSMKEALEKLITLPDLI